MKTVIDGISINEKKEILLVKKGKKWILPGGKMDEGENELKCLEREIDEELSKLEFEVIGYYKDFVGITPTSKTPVLCKTYFIQIADNLITPSAEISDAKYTKDFDSLLLSDVTQDIIMMLQQDGYL